MTAIGKTAEAKTRIETEYPQIIKDIKILKYTLLPLEFWCLEKIFQIKQPLSTGYFYNKYLLHTFASLTKKEIEKTKMKIDFGKGNLLLKENLDHKAYRYNLKISSLSAETFREIEKELREKKVSFPSYKKTLSTLERLEKWNFITRRYEEGTKEKFYWIINPIFYSKFGRQFEEVIKKDKS